MRAVAAGAQCRQRGLGYPPQLYRVRRTRREYAITRGPRCVTGGSRRLPYAVSSAHERHDQRFVSRSQRYECCSRVARQ